jgi:hypothetical protein
VYNIYAALDDDDLMMTISTEKKPHSDVPERRTIKRAVTIYRAELKLEPAVAADSNARHCVRLARARPGAIASSSSQGKAPRDRAGGTTRRRHLLLVGQGDVNDRRAQLVF